MLLCFFAFLRWGKRDRDMIYKLISAGPFVGEFRTELAFCNRLVSKLEVMVIKGS